MAESGTTAGDGTRDHGDGARGLGYWNYEQVARMLDVSKSTIERLVRHKQIPFVRIGRWVRFCPDDVKTWLRQGGTANVSS